VYPKGYLLGKDVVYARPFDVVTGNAFVSATIIFYVSIPAHRQYRRPFINREHFVKMFLAYFPKNRLVTNLSLSCIHLF